MYECTVCGGENAEFVAPGLALCKECENDRRIEREYNIDDSDDLWIALRDSFTPEGEDFDAP